MRFDPQRHHRRSIRLAGYDYSQPGAYFVTTCTHNRALSLEAEAVKTAVLTAWDSLPGRFPHVTLDEFVVMPNHVHGILMFGFVAETAEAMVPATHGVGAPLAAPMNRVAASIAGAASSAPTLGRVVRAFKSVSAIEANRTTGRSGQPFWQRNYYEHIIRDEDELNIIRQYIQDNPLKWNEDPDNPANR